MSATTSHSEHLENTWHSLEASECLTLLETDQNSGLSVSEVTIRQNRYGKNELKETGGRSPWDIWWDQFKNIMLLMLIAVALISGGLELLDIQAGKSLPGEIPFKDPIAIFAIVILNAILGYLQETKAEKALAALKNLAPAFVQVFRDGKIQQIASIELVPGDIMLLEAGVQVPADGRLISVANLQVKEAALTGETAAINKTAQEVLPKETQLGDRNNMTFQGTEVVYGRGKVLITATGMQTEIGKIAAMLQGVEAEETPLQKRMSQLGNTLVLSSLILVALVIVTGLIINGWNFQEFQNLLEVSLSMAVAVVPEGLPAVVTVTLALGTQRMVKRNALIRRLPAVETLGSVTTICSDKTGTLTQNKMVVKQINTHSCIWSVSGEGYAPIGNFTLSQSIATIEPNETDLEQQNLLVACVVCNDAILTQNQQQEWEILGDPTEGALLSLAGKSGIYRENTQSKLARVEEFPFSSERKRMSVICENHSNYFPLAIPDTPYLMFTKGSPELTLACCQQIAIGGISQELTPVIRERILQQNDEMASQGLRVLGLACKALEEIPKNQAATDVETDLVWLGLAGMIDMPRVEVRDAVIKCKEAGIRPIMITGDHKLTARAIAIDLGIADQEKAQVLTGQDLEKFTYGELQNAVMKVNVYARVSPEHKLKIVQALQSNHQVVAMTGDGVNDAPALKQADIGIAMGITGTDVSKEASDMILLDDNFATIVAATEEGRVVYTNIRRFIKYVLGSNIGEVITIATTPFLGLPGSPLIPLQILWMNLVTDGLPALALAVEPAEPNVMKRSPISPQESIFARGLGSYMIRIGIIFSVITIALMLLAYNDTRSPSYQGEPDAWRTMVFTTLCLAQMGHAIAIRSNTQLIWELNPFANPFVWGAAIITTILQLMLIYVPPLRSFFGTHYLNLTQLGACIGCSLLVFVWIEGEKLVIRWYMASKNKH